MPVPYLGIVAPAPILGLLIPPRLVHSYWLWVAVVEGDHHPTEMAVVAVEVAARSLPLIPRALLVAHLMVYKLALEVLLIPMVFHLYLDLQVLWVVLGLFYTAATVGHPVMDMLVVQVLIPLLVVVGVEVKRLDLMALVHILVMEVMVVPVYQAL